MELGAIIRVSSSLLSPAHLLECKQFGEATEHALATALGAVTVGTGLGASSSLAPLVTPLLHCRANVASVSVRFCLFSTSCRCMSLI
jgi:hypothetical protein